MTGHHHHLTADLNANNSAAAQGLTDQLIAAVGPRRDDAWYRARLTPPGQGQRLRVVIDADAANEIDDQFALAWALLAPERLDVLAVYAAPFSFEHRRREMIRARDAQRHPAAASPADLELLHLHAPRLALAERRGWVLETLDLPVFNPPAVGMQRSFDEILRVFEALRLPSAGRVFRGSTGYLPGLNAPLHSQAVDHLIATARATPADGPPLYVVAIGCVTNIASALLLAPDIARHIVVIWTSGYPSHAPYANFSLNLEQDLLASQWLFDSGVPLVYLPGHHVGAQLRLSLPEMQAYVQGRGAMGDYLYHLYTHNPLWEFAGIDSFFAHSWVIWDVINIAWMLNPQWVPSELVRTPRLDADRRWQPDAGRHLMREAYGVQRDAIFNDLFGKLDLVV